MLKIYEAFYFKSGRGCNYERGCGVVVANNRTEALGICLQNHEGTVAEGWNFDEIDTTEVHQTVYMEEYP